jgi:hypothetical protein
VIIDNKKFRVVVIDYPINILDDKMCASLFSKTLHMKRLGYQVTYGDSAMPMDKSDFFSTHIIFCEEKDDELIPIIAYKATNYDRCLFHSFEFPATSLMKSDGHPSCVEKIDEILSSIKDPSKISFDSCWAQNLEYRFSSNSELKNILREITMMFAVKHHQEFGIPHMMTCGVVKVKTDQFFLRIGLNKLNEHALFKQKNLNDEDVVIFYNDQFSLEARSMAKKYAGLWEDKLMIDGLRVSKPNRKAA